jgi:hypothetical protein
MTLAFLLAVQTAAAPVSREIVLLDFDLGRVPARAVSVEELNRCRPARGDEIVVCGRALPDSRYRLQELGHAFDDRPPRAERGLGGGRTIGAYAESADLPGGLTSNRIMITFKLPF